MAPEAAIIVAFFIIIAALVVVVSIVNGRRMREKEEEMRQGASSRGWTFTKVHEHGYRIYRYAGTTDGVPWVAESARFTAGGNNRQKRRHVARWHGQWSPGVSGPIVGMGLPKGKEQIGATVAEGDGFFARMAQKAAGFAFDKAIDVYFGKEIGDQVDAGELRRVESVAVPGFLVMALLIDDAKRVMAEGLEKALLDATNDQRNVLSENDRPWVLVRPQGISLARMEQFRSIAELEQFIHAGIGLTRAFRFGRRA